jgi:hypothetical protein
VVREGDAGEGDLEFCMKNTMTWDFDGDQVGGLPCKKILFFRVFSFISLPSVPKITLGKDPFTDQKFTMWPLPSVAFGKGFTECIWASAKSYSQRSLEFCTKNIMTWDFDKDQVRGLKFLFF